MTTPYTPPSIDEYLRKRLMPVEGAIPHVQGIEMYGSSRPAGTVGGDLFEYAHYYLPANASTIFSRLARHPGTMPLTNATSRAQTPP